MEYWIKDTSTAAVDVKGYHDKQWKQTTYGNNGYRVVKSDGLGNATITAAPEFINDGRFVQLKWIVTATNGEVTNGKFAIYSDIQIGGNDRAPIECILNKKNQVIGFKMCEKKDDPSAAQFNLFFNQSGGVTNVDSYWFGHFSTAPNYPYDMITSSNATGGGTFTKDSSGRVTGVTDVDSGVIFSWQNIKLKKGESKVFSVLVGVGEAADPPEFGDETNPDIPPIKLVMDLDATKNNLKIDVNAKVKDTAGVTDVLHYEVVGGEKGTLDTITADGTVQNMTGQLDLTGWPDGEYTLNFWLSNSKGVMSETVTCKITIKNGAVTGDENFEKPAEGDHNWSDKWSYDDHDHWHICENGNCTITDVTQNKDYGPHERDEGTLEGSELVIRCKECGYVIARIPQPVRHDIAYEPNEGEMPSNARDFYYEGQEFPLTIPTKKCYTFEGWYEGPDFSGAPVDKILSTDTGDRKFYAKWKENEKHGIKFDTDGGETPGGTKDTFTEGEDGELPIPKKDGFIFDGWYTDPDFKGDPVTKIDPNAKGDLKFYAKWKVDPSRMNLPKTGDTTNPLMWAGVLVVAVACVIGLKKKHA